MLKNPMEDKRLDLDAPLLSVRRFAPVSELKQSPPPAAGGGNPIPYPKRSALPFYKSDLKSGPVRDPGVVPFIWERYPGQPKHGARLDRPSVAPKLKPVRILIDKESDNPSSAAEDEMKLIETDDEIERPSNLAECNEDEHREEEEEDKFSDALETLSRTESSFMNCSVSGMSGIPQKAEGSGSFSTDPQVRDFMMGRFLPAARAVATGSSHASSRRPPVQAREPTRVVAERAGNGEQRLVRFPMNYQHAANFVQEGEGTSCSYEYEDDEEDEEDCYDNGNFSSKVCGLIPKFCLLNPVPAMKLSNHRLPPTSVRRVRGLQIKAMQHGSSGQADEENSWEAVYKHKLMHGDPPPPQGEDVSKLTSESNNLSYLSDSLTADGSSPQHRSYIGGISPYRNEPSQSPFQEGKGFLGVPRRDHKGSKTDGSDSIEKDESYWVVTSHHSSKCESGSVSPTVERALHADAAHIPATPRSKSSSIGTSSDNKDRTRSADEVSEVGVQIHRMDESRDLETYDQVPLQAKVTNIVEPGLTLREETSDWGVMHENNGFKCSDHDDSPLCLKEENEVKKVADPMLPLLSPPLPNSPSESWLSRTLPSVSAKNPSAQSFLGIHCQPRKQTFNSCVALPKKEIPVKPLKVRRGQTRFSDMLAKPLSPQSEI